MRKGIKANRAWLKSFLLGGGALFLVVSLVLYPETAFKSSLEGLQIWWEVVFPALLPFFIASEILMGFGVVHFLGVLLEPFMRPVFRVPGPGAFVMAMGLASGYPIGAKLTTRLREQGLITRSEGERLVSFTNTADPLFMFGAVAVGFFHDVSLGVTLAVAHYSSSLLTGIAMRFHDPRGETSPPMETSREFFLVRAVKAMHNARLKDGRPFGTLIGDSVMNSIQTLLMIGGLMMIFSVLIEVMSMIDVTTLLAHAFAFILMLLGLPTDLSTAMISGLFEITLGAKATSEFKDTLPMIYLMAIVSTIVAWSGLCVHAQVASLLSTTDIRYKPYLFARMLHGLLAGVITVIVWNPVQRYLLTSDAAIPAFLQQLPNNSFSNLWSRLEFIGFRVLLLLLALIGIAILMNAVQTIVSRKKR